MAFQNEELFVNEGLCYPDGELLSPLERLAGRNYVDFSRERAHVFFDSPVEGVVTGVVLMRALMIRAEAVGLPISLASLAKYLDVEVPDIEARLLVQMFKERIKQCGLALFEADLVDKNGEALRCLEVGWKEIICATRAKVEASLAAKPEPDLDLGLGLGLGLDPGLDPDPDPDPDDDCSFAKGSPYRVAHEKLQEICGQNRLLRQILEWIFENYDEGFGGVDYEFLTARFKLFNEARISKVNEEALSKFGLKMVLDDDILYLRFL